MRVVGPDWEPQERAMLNSLQLGDGGEIILEQLYALGLDKQRRDEKLRELYQQASALVHPSLYEGFGLTLLEAIACGCPIAASRIPSTVEIIGDYPIYFDPESTEDMQVAFSSVLVHGRSNDKEKAGARILSRYSWDQMAQLTLEAYRALAERK